MCFFFIKHDGTPEPSLFHRLRVRMVYAVIHLPIEAQRWLHTSGLWEATAVRLSTHLLVGG